MAVDQSEITSMNETQTPSGDSKVFINNNGEFEQCELDKLMEATELFKKVSDVNTSLNNLITIGGIPITELYGYSSNKYYTYDNGQITDYTGWIASDLIPCNSNELNIFVDTPDKNIDNNKFNIFFDENRNFISNFSLVTGCNTINIPKNAKYYAISESAGTYRNTYIASTKISNKTEFKLYAKNNQNIYITLIKQNKNVVFYMNFENLPNDVNNISFSELPNEFKPMNYGYNIYNFFTNTQPYLPVGSLWIGNNGSVTLYKETTTKSGYVSGSYPTI